MDEKNENLGVKNNSDAKNEPLIHDFNKENLKSVFSPKIIALLIAVVAVGLISGYLLSGMIGGGLQNSSQGGSLNGGSISKGTVVGSNDTKLFKDTAEGLLKQGGIDGEGAFHLVRSGGASQNVYLTSSIVDLSKFINKKIKVWGQTQKAQTAGWLMDVGRVEVL